MLLAVHPELVGLRVMHGFGGCQMPPYLPTLADLKEFGSSVAVAFVFSVDSDVAAVGCPENEKIQERKPNVSPEPTD